MSGLVLDRTEVRTDRWWVRELVAQHGGRQLSYLVTWSGNRYWFAPGRSGVVAYRLIGRVALTVGEPVCAPDDSADVVLRFTAFCVRNGWTPCWYGVGGGLAGYLAASGWSRVQVAEEAAVSLPDLRMTGRSWQDVRTARNRAKREGITAHWHRYRPGPDPVSDQIREISRAWVDAKGLPEMGFTLGSLAELDDDEVRCLTAVAADGTVLAVTSWLPIREDYRIIGWTLDVMRRRPDTPNGVMEFLIATAALSLKEEGASILGLSGAPLARLDSDCASGRVQRLLDRFSRALEPVYGFRSLLAFKAKFHPQCRPLYLVCPGAGSLPRVGWAVTRAYLPDLTLRQAARIAANLAAARHPVKRRPVKRGPVERGPVERGPVERGPVERRPGNRGRVERGQPQPVKRERPRPATSPAVATGPTATVLCDLS